MPIKILSILLICSGIAMIANGQTVYKKQSPKMMFGDTSRVGVPYANDPFVVSFEGRYLMYYSIPPYKDKSNPVQGWGIGIAESKDLNRWSKIAGTTPEGDYEKKGLCAPCALVIDKQVNLFYQTYGNGANDAICHAVSNDGIHFKRVETNPIFHPTGNWNCGRAIDAEVFRSLDKYFLYFATRDPGSWNYSESGHPHLFKDENGKTFLFFQGNNDNGKTWYISKLEVRWNENGPYLRN